MIQSRILHWFNNEIHVDNCNVKTKLICNESPFQQADMFETIRNLS